MRVICPCVCGEGGVVERKWLVFFRFLSASHRLICSMWASKIKIKKERKYIQNISRYLQWICHSCCYYFRNRIKIETIIRESDWKINSDQGENSAIIIVINFTLSNINLWRRYAAWDWCPHSSEEKTRVNLWSKGSVGRNTGFAVICQSETQRKPSLAEEQGFMGLYLCACLQTD